MQMNLKKVPLEIFEMTHLESLDLSYNELASLPAELATLTKLTSLNLKYSKDIQGITLEELTAMLPGCTIEQSFA